MSTNEKPKSEVARTLAEEAASAGTATIVGLLVAGPVGAVAGTAASILIKGAIAGARQTFQARAVKRAEAFDHELGEAATSSAPEDIARLAESEGFAEVVFQNYRRAMDALDPSVVPALARLTWLYKDQPPDAFFRGWGRLLEDLSGEEFYALRQLLSAVVQYNESCEVVPWKTSQQVTEIRLKPLHAPEPVRGYTPRPGVRRVLALLTAHDLTDDPHYAQGATLAMTGDTKLDLDLCKRALYFVQPLTVILFPATFDRTSDDE